MAPKKYTPSLEWNQNSPPGLHKGARNLRESLKMKNPNDFKPPPKESKGFKKVGEAISKPEVVTELPPHIESPKEKVEDLKIGTQGSSYLYRQSSDAKEVMLETVELQEVKAISMEFVGTASGSAMPGDTVTMVEVPSAETVTMVPTPSEVVSVPTVTIVQEEKEEDRKPKKGKKAKKE